MNPEMLRKDKDVIIANQEWALQFADESLKKDKDVVLAAVSDGYGSALEYADDSIKSEPDIVLAAQGN